MPKTITPRRTPQTPPQVEDEPVTRQLILKYPSTDTLRVIRLYAQKAKIDRDEAIERLLLLGVRAWLRARRSGQQIRTVDPARRSENARNAARARWAKRLEADPAGAKSAP